jgi:hypothetical protein
MGFEMVSVWNIAGQEGFNVVLTSNRDAVPVKIAKELGEGRIAGPFSDVPFR